MCGFFELILQIVQRHGDDIESTRVGFVFFVVSLFVQEEAVCQLRQVEALDVFQFF